MMSLTIMTRLSSKGVPWKAKGAGKKSSMLGGSKPLPSEDAGSAPTVPVATIALVITSPPRIPAVPPRNGLICQLNPKPRTVHPKTGSAPR